MDLITSLTIEPSIYEPMQDSTGVYIDYIPSFNAQSKNANGIRCPCSSKRDKIYKTSSSLSTHCKTLMHKQWLSTVNANRHNLFIDNQTLTETVRQQQIIITELSNELANKNMQINYLFTTIITQNKPSTATNTSTEIDLINID